MITTAAKKNLTVVLPVWGEYWHFLPRALDNIKQEGIAPHQILLAINGEKIPDTIHSSGLRKMNTDLKLTNGSLRNQALLHVKTEFVLYFSITDLIVPGSVDLLLAELIEHPGSVATTGLSMQENGTICSWTQYQSAGRKICGQRWSVLLKQWARNNYFLSTGAIIKTEALNKVGCFPDLDLIEDSATAAALLATGDIIMLPQATRKYCLHESMFYQKGCNRAEWREKYKQQRQWLRENNALPLYLRYAVALCAPFHYLEAARMEKRAKDVT